ncbi:MAG: FG-GAP repeat domain-containing protein [Planctomycetota bacterium]
MPLFRWDNPNDSGPFNTTRAFYRQLSDVDGDGFPEILFPDRSAQPEVVLWIWSLAKNQLLFTVSTSPLTTLGLSSEALITINDINGDGIEDMAIGKSSATTGGVLSGKDGSLLVQFTSDGVFGIALITPAGDIDGDGFGDIINDGGGDIRFFSGRTGQVILLLPRDLPDGRERDFVMGVGDVDAGGRDDWAEGWRGDFLGHPSPTCIIPCIAFFSGLPPRRIGLVEGRETPDMLWTGPYFHFDFDGDGTQDNLYRGSRSNPLSDCLSGFAPFYISIYSPARDIFLRVWAHDLVGPIQSMDEDWNGDGFPDLLTVAVEGELFPRTTLQLLTTGNHLDVFPSSLSRGSGGVLTFKVDAGHRFANRRVLILPETAPSGPSISERLPLEWEYKNRSVSLSQPIPSPSAPGKTDASRNGRPSMENWMRLARRPWSST